MRFINALSLVIGMVLYSGTQAREALVFAGGGVPNDPFDKISKDVLIEAYRRIGVEISFQVIPPPRALMMSNEGVLDGEMHRIRGIDKVSSNLVMIPVAINKIEVLAFTKNSDIAIHNIKDLKPYLIGIRRGVKFSEDISQGMNVQKVGNVDQLFRMLDLGRIDVALSTRTAGFKMINKLNLEAIKTINSPLDTKKLYHYLHKKHQSIIPQVTKSLQAMEKEQLIQKIYERAMSDLLKYNK